MYKLNQLIPTVLCVLVLVATAGIASAVRETQSLVVSQGQVVDHDALAYAEAFGVEFVEAQRRLAMQEEIGQLNAVLMQDSADTFGGLWIEHGDVFQVVILFTENGDAISKQRLSDELKQIVTTRSAKWSLSQLEADQKVALEILRGQNHNVSSGINIQKNQVEMYADNASELASRATKSGQKLPETVQIVESVDTDPVSVEPTNPIKPSTPVKPSVPVKPTTGNGDPLNRYIFGGRKIGNASGAYCTSGLALTTPGMSTAGHCPNSLQYPYDNQFSRTSIGAMMNELYDDPGEEGHDVQWHNTIGLTELNAVYDGLDDIQTPFYRYLREARPKSMQFPGMYACFHGATSGFNCGILGSTSFAPNGSGSCSANNNAPVFVAVNLESGATVDGGDSGAAMFTGSTALGIVVCKIGSDLIYSATDQVEDVSPGNDIMTEDSPALVVYKAYYGSGWQNYYSFDGETAGSDGLIPSRTRTLYLRLGGAPGRSICYSVYTEELGAWSVESCDGAPPVSESDNSHIWAFKAYIVGDPDCNVNYEARFQNSGWIPSEQNNDVLGDPTNEKDMYGLRVWLSGSCN